MTVAADIILSRMMALWASVSVDVEPKQIEEPTEGIVPDTLLHAEHVSVVAIDYFIDDCMGQWNAQGYSETPIGQGFYLQIFGSMQVLEQRQNEQ